jgi:uncharacterized protein YejL (UPF0352 family)
MPITATEIAAILEKHYGPIDVGQGVLENGLQTNCLYVHNKKKKHAK